MRRGALHDAARWGDAKVAQLLLEAGAEVNALDKGRDTPLSRAEEQDHTQVADLLRQHGVRSVAEWSGVHAYFDRVPGGWTEDGKVLVVEHQRRLTGIDPDSGERTVIFDAMAAKGAER